MKKVLWQIMKRMILLVVLYGAVRVFEWKSLYYPSRTIAQVPSDIGMPYETVEIVTEDGVRLHAWWIPHEAARGSVIICHGNAGNIGDRVWIAQDLHSFGVNVLLFDYRGYGKSGGLTTEEGTYRDIRAAFEHVRSRHGGVEHPPVLLYGRSLGGAVALQGALDKPVRGLILENTFASVKHMARALYPVLPVHWIVHFRYDNAAKIASLTVPVLIANSEDDEMIPFEQGRLLFERAPEPKTFQPLRGGHNDSGWHITAEYWQSLKAFVDETLPPGG